MPTDRVTHIRCMEYGILMTNTWFRKPMALSTNIIYNELQIQTNATWHYDDVTMGAIASLITSLTIVYLTVYSDADQRKHQSSASLAFVWGIHRGPVNPPHKWPVTRKMLPFDDVIMNVCVTVEPGWVWASYVSIMTAKALAPGVARTLVAIILLLLLNACAILSRSNDIKYKWT